MKKEKYDSRKLKRHSSGTELVYKRRRLILIALWFVICIGIGVVVYNGYSKKHMSDTPANSSYSEEKVTTGNELLENVPFGPWMAEPVTGK